MTRTFNRWLVGVGSISSHGIQSEQAIQLRSQGDHWLVLGIRKLTVIRIVLLVPSAGKPRVTILRPIERGSPQVDGRNALGEPR